MALKFAIIGCGEIGGEILRNLTSIPGSVVRITRRNEKKGREIAAKYNASYFRDNKEAVRGVDVIFLTVRPSDMAGVMEEISEYVNAGQFLISTAAAISIEYMRKFFNENVISRYIPSPLITENGGVGIIAGDIPEKYSSIISGWSKKFHKVEEKDMHLYTILSSSGSAFISAALVNILDKLPCDDKDFCKKIVTDVIETTMSSVKGKGLDECRQIAEFCSTPGGITAEGIGVLNSENAKEIFSSVVSASLEKSLEMQKKFEK